MREYPFSDTPPNVPGIYALKARTTGQIYIGQTQSLRSRYAAWRSTLMRGSFIVTKAMRRAAEAVPYTDWVFIVLAERPGASASELDAVEEAAIRSMVAKLANRSTPDLLLNVEGVLLKYKPPPKGVLRAPPPLTMDHGEDLFGTMSS